MVWSPEMDLTCPILRIIVGYGEHDKETTGYITSGDL
jgi:hypothetical protein